jgi:hypothetical protein
MAATATLAKGTPVTGLFHQNGEAIRVTGTVVQTYAATLHGFDVRMVTVACSDGRNRHLLAGYVQALPIERRYVRVMQFAPAGTTSTTDELFEGTLNDFMTAFGVTEAQGAHNPEGEAEGIGAEGHSVTVIWNAA